MGGRYLGRIVIFCAALLTAVPAGASERLTVFAAASLADAMGDLETLWEDATGGDLVVSLAGSSTLARQIIAGAPADVFVSANPGWMDTVGEAGRLVAGTRIDLATNRIVLVAAAGEPDVTVAQLSDRLGDRRLAMALVEAVPAGIYGKAALEHLGLWDALSPKVAQAKNVRAALAMVASGAAPYGIVYASDALAEPRVRVVETFPAGSHPPILYPAAAIAGGNAALAAGFLAFLHGAEARTVLADNGFGLGD